MSLDENLEMVRDQIRAESEAGQYVLIWASLPCTPWCQWQYVNAAEAAKAGKTEEFQADLERQRETSRVLIRGLKSVLLQVLKKKQCL